MQAKDAIHFLRESLTNKQTGCLTSQDGVSYRVFVMNGDILAAHGPDDGNWIVRRLVNNGAITEGQGRQVIFYLGQGYRLEELLLDQVPDQLFLELLSERFRQNLLDFSFLKGPVQFEKMDAIFVYNIQVGHDSFALIRDITSLRDRIAPLRQNMDQLRIQPGSSRPRSRREARVLDLCQGPTTLAELIGMSPYEPGPTFDLVKQMLACQTLETLDSPLTQHQPSTPPPPVVPPIFADQAPPGAFA